MPNKNLITGVELDQDPLIKEADKEADKEEADKEADKEEADKEADKEEADKEEADKEEDTEKIKNVLYEVLHNCDSTMSALFTNEIKKIAEKMHQNQIITIDLYRNPSYDAIIQCFQGALNFMKNKEDMQAHCSNFVKSIKEVKEEAQNRQKKKWEQLATAIKNGWKTEVKNKLGIDFTVD